MIIIYFDAQENIVTREKTEMCCVWRIHTHVYHVIIISLPSKSTHWHEISTDRKLLG